MNGVVRPAMGWLTVLTLAVPCADSAACTCAEMSPRAHLKGATAVFVGTVTSKTLVPQPADTVRAPAAGGRRPRVVRPTVYRYGFAVTHVWKGAPLPERFLVVPTEGGMCGVQFEVGETRVVYAVGREDPLTTNSCSRPRRLEQAWADLLELGPPQPVGDAPPLWIPEATALFDSLASGNPAHVFAADEALQYVSGHAVLDRARAILRGERAGDRLRAIRFVGDQGSAGAVAKSELLPFLADPSGRARAVTVAALARVLPPAERGAVFQAALADSETDVIMSGLQYLGASSRVDSLPEADALAARVVALWSHPDSDVRRYAIQKFGEVFPDRVRGQRQRLEQVIREDPWDSVVYVARRVMEAGQAATGRRR